MNVSTSNGSSYSTRASTNKGMSGMISGMDTEGMVESMLSGIQGKIDKQNGLKQTTTWKQESYRDIISSINAFKSKFFDFSSSTNLKSNSFFNNMAAASKAYAFKVSADSSAAAGRTNVIVEQLASATSAKSAGTVSGTLSGDFNAAALDKKVTFLVDGSEVEVNLNGVTDQTAATALINTALAAKGAKAELVDGALKITAGGKDQEVRISSKSSKLGLEAIGLSAGSKTYRKATNVMGPDPIDPTAPEIVIGQDITYEMSSVLKLDAKVTLEITLDNNEKTLTLDPNEFLNSSNQIDATKFKDALQVQLDKFGKGQITATLDGSGKIGLSVGTGRRLYVGGDDMNSLNALGMKQDQSNKLATAQQLKDLNFSSGSGVPVPLEGGMFKFDINGTKFEFKETDSLSKVMSTINSSSAGVRVTYLPNEDKFAIEATYSGEGIDITMEQTSGNLLTAMFGVNAGSSVISSEFVKNNIKSDTAIDTSGLTTKGGAFEINVDGRKYSISVPKQYETNPDGTYKVRDKDGKPSTINPDGTLKAGDTYVPKEYTKTEVMQLVNEGLQSQFGYTAGGEQNIELTPNGMEIRNGAKVSFDALSDELAPGGVPDEEAIKKMAGTGTLSLMFGLNGVKEKNNTIDADTTLADVGITTGKDKNGNPLDGTAKLTDLAGYADGRITLDAGTLDNLDDAAVEKLFGSAKADLKFGDGIWDAANRKIDKGQNAIVEINDVRTERNSNNFTIDGLNLELLEVSKKDTAGDFVSESIDVTRDTEQIFKGVKEFVDEYNKMIGVLNDLVDEDPTFKDYPPLTATQKSQMSETEIKAWEKKAQTGLLRNDSSINGFLSGMRTAMYQKPEGAKYALYNIGITTTSTYEDKGKLVIDEKILKQMIQNDPEEMQNLFNGDGTGVGAGRGLMNMLEDTIKSTANTSSGDPGELVRLAGTKSTALASQNTLSRQILDINERVRTLSRTYETQRAKYWKQFNAMEKALSDMNAQSQSLGQMFG